MAKTKLQKRNEARKNAEAIKAKRKAMRASNANFEMGGPRKKGRSMVPQGKKKK